MPNTEPRFLPVLQVAVGVVKDARGHILIALREPTQHQGGLWEFPGGKLELGESAEQALVRELKEELNVTVESATPLITIKHKYPKISVQLNVFLVERFSGPVQSCEGQPFKWIAIESLQGYEFPKANQAIINALRLPDRYAILDDSDEEPLPIKLDKLLGREVKLIQARLKHSSVQQVQAFIPQALAACRQHNARLLINSAVANAQSLNADGLHLTSRDLMTLHSRPAGIKWLAASCHNQIELEQAQKIAVDFVVLAPVQTTASHPDAQAMGWQRFAELVADVNMPTFALGGMAEADITIAKQAGAQGIAGISTFLSD